MNNNRLAFYIILGIIVIPFVFQFLFGTLILTFVISSFNPISETATCRNNRCTTVGNHIIFTTNQHPEQRVTNKSELEIQTIPDNIFHLNQYYIRMRNNNERYLFRTAYLTRSAAERDLRKVKENNSTTVTKRNVIFIQGLCITVYIILLIIGNIINRVRQHRNNNPSLNMQYTEGQNRARQN